MTRQKPILFLDVDGVLNVFGKDFEQKEVQLRGDKFTHRIYPSKHTLPFMRWAWAQFEVFWCTAWGPDANVIAAWAGLSEKPWAADRSNAALDWKLAGIQRVLGKSRRMSVWIEDGIGEQAEAWVAKRRKFIYIHTSHKVGVTKAHAQFLADCLGLSMEAWNGKQ